MQIAPLILNYFSKSAEQQSLRNHTANVDWHTRNAHIAYDCAIDSSARNAEILHTSAGLIAKDNSVTVQHLHHFNIRAPGVLLESVRDFYIGVLGLVEGERPPFRFAGHWLYAGGHPVVHLMAAREEQSSPGEVGSIDHVAFACSDYEATCRHLEQRGIAFRATTVPGTQQRQVFIRDPLGNGIELNFTPAEGSAAT